MRRTATLQQLRERATKGYAFADITPAERAAIERYRETGAREGVPSAWLRLADQLETLLMRGETLAN